MSDSRRPNPPHAPPPSFEVPDLVLEPVLRPLRQPEPARSPAPVKAPSNAQDQLFGSAFDFGADGELEDLEFERSAQPNFQLLGGGESAPRIASAKRAQPAVDARPVWPAGRALDAAQLTIDSREVSILADYGDPPDSVPLTLAYAYRVFTRQRELKRQLIPIAAECEHAQAQLEATLAEFSRAMRPAIEPLAEFRRFFAPLLELEQRAAERGRALHAINAQLGAETGQFDAELAQIAGQREVQERLEREAQRQFDEREADAKRADAKWKRVQIEVRALTQVAERKLAPGGQIPDPEAAQLASLRQHAEALQPEAERAHDALEQAKQALAQVHARLDALSQSDRQIARKKQALGSAYQKQLSARSQGVSETEVEQRTALADLARALLAAPGTVDVSEAWLERVRRVSDHANQLIVRAEMQRRAITAYDAARARQGVQLACTAALLLLLLFAFKLIF